MLFYEGIETETLGLLKQLVAFPELESFALVGGTGLALQLGHRLSVDLDFFTRDEFDREKLEESLASTFSLKILGRDTYSLNCLLDGIKVDFIRHRYPLLENLVIEDQITLWSVVDIAAAKISAITKRGAKKDFYDLVEILKHISLESVLSAYEKKYPSGERFMAMKSLNWFEDADEEPDPISLRNISWGEVKDTILIAVGKL